MKRKAMEMLMIKAILASLFVWQAVKFIWLIKNLEADKWIPDQVGNDRSEEK